MVGLAADGLVSSYWNHPVGMVIDFVDVMAIKTNVFYSTARSRLVLRSFLAAGYLLAVEGIDFLGSLLAGSWRGALSISLLA